MHHPQAKPQTATQVLQTRRGNFLLLPYFLYKREYNKYILYLLYKTESYTVINQVLHSRKNKPMKISLSIFLYAIVHLVSAQTIIQGKVLDAKTKLPLSRATIKVKAQNIESSSGPEGGFEIRVKSSVMDSLEVSHVGYKTFKRNLDEVSSPITIAMED